MTPGSSERVTELSTARYSLVRCLQALRGCCCTLSSRAASASASPALLGRCRLLPFAAACRTAGPAAAASLDGPEPVRAEGTPSLLRGAGDVLRALLTGLPAGMDLLQHKKNFIYLNLRDCRFPCSNLSPIEHSKNNRMSPNRRHNTLQGHKTYASAHVSM